MALSDDDLIPMTSGMVLIVVGSTNPVKIEAVRRVFKKIKSSLTVVIVEGYDVPSHVSDQPWGDEETRRGAEQRALGALAAARAKWELQLSKDKTILGPSYGVGLEGGVADAANGGLDSVGCMAIVRAADDRMSVARTASFPLPPRVARLLRGDEPGHPKMELGDADDLVFKDIDSKRKGGAVAKVTHGLLDRQSYYEHALFCAYAPFHHDASGLYDGHGGASADEDRENRLLWEKAKNLCCKLSGVRAERDARLKRHKAGGHDY